MTTLKRAWTDNRFRHGAQGTMDGASNAALDNEFGTHDEDEVIKQILTKGSIQSGEVCTTLLLPCGPFSDN